MVNHYTLSNGELIERLIEVVRDNTYVVMNDKDKDFVMKDVNKNQEYYDIISELSYRLKGSKKLSYK